jgi:transposase
MERVEMVTSIQRRRRFTREQKRAIVEEAEQPGMSISVVARKCEINPSQVFKWRRLMYEGALVAAGSEDQMVPASEVKQLKAELRELQRLFGKKTMEVEILKDAIRVAREKNLSHACPCRRRTIPHEGNHRYARALPPLIVPPSELALLSSTCCSA